MSGVRFVTLGLILVFSTGTARAGDRAADAEAEMARADGYMAQHDWDAAIAHYNAARLLAPDRPGPYRGLGMAYYDADRCADAIPALEQYLEIKRERPWPRAVRALAECRDRTAPAPVEPPPEPRRALPEREVTPSAPPAALDPAIAESMRAARIEYQRNKIDVCGSGGNYEFCTVQGRITENELIRRFKKMTGSHELDRFLSLRNKGAIGVWTTIGLLGVGAVAAGGALYNTPCMKYSDNQACNDGNDMLKVGASYTTDTAKYLLYIGIAAWATSSLGYFVYGGLNFDGKTTEHKISEFDARIYVERYNRALDARIRADSAAHGQPLPPAPLGDPAPASARRDVIDRPSPSIWSRVRLVPVLGPGGLGLAGQF
jgi:hypothetical protein